jgi:hypothetical protein
MTNASNLGDLLEDSPSNWGKWGPYDEVGALNYLTAADVLRGVAHISAWQAFTLQRLIGDPNGDPVWPGRNPAEREQIVDESAWDEGGDLETSPGERLAGQSPRDHMSTYTDRPWLGLYPEGLINASGYKVWPREVEDVLCGHPAVREAAVVGMPDPYWGEPVQAIVSLEPGQSATAPELIEYTKTRMAAYKYPRTIQFLDEIPKTASGKLLRRELRDRTTA